MFFLFFKSSFSIESDLVYPEKKSKCEYFFRLKFFSDYLGIPDVQGGDSSALRFFFIMYLYLENQIDQSLGDILKIPEKELYNISRDSYVPFKKSLLVEKNQDEKSLSSRNIISEWKVQEGIQLDTNNTALVQFFFK